jgi:hypothetical protein
MPRLVGRRVLFTGKSSPEFSLVNLSSQPATSILHSALYTSNTVEGFLLNIPTITPSSFSIKPILFQMFNLIFPIEILKYYFKISLGILISGCSYDVLKINFTQFSDIFTTSWLSGFLSLHFIAPKTI